MSPWQQGVAAVYRASITTRCIWPVIAHWRAYEPVLWSTVGSHQVCQHTTAGQLSCTPVVVHLYSTGSCAGKPRGGRLFWASIRSRLLPRRMASLIYLMMSFNEITRLATREPLVNPEAVVARQGLRSRQARPGRHSATALTIACWNIRSLGVTSDLESNMPRKSGILDRELDRLGISIAAISETWLTGCGSIREENYTIFWSGYADGDRPRHGVGFAVRNNALLACEEPVSVSPRLMSLRLRTNCGYCSLLSAYAPTLLADSDSKDEFYSQLSQHLLGLPRGDRVVILGDLNARIGSDSNSWPNILGPHGIGTMNENGQRLLEFCATHSLCIPNTFFESSSRAKVTWMHPRSRRWHQLDHIIVRRRDLKSVVHCRSMHSADCESDHALVRCKLRMTTKKIHLSRPKPLPVVNILTTKVGGNVQRFQESLSKAFLDSPAPSNEPAACWTRLSSTVSKCAYDTFGKRTRRQPDWFRVSADILIPALEAKRSARLAFISNPRHSTRAAFQAAKCNMQREVRSALQRYWEDLSARIVACSESGNIHGMYEGIKEALGPTPKKTAPLLSSDGHVLSELPDQLDRWVEHYSSLYSQEVAADVPAIEAAIPQMPVMDDLDLPISRAEIERAIRSLQLNKSPGVDGIPPEVLKCGGESLHAELHSLFSLCWEQRCIPQDLKDANIVTLYKNKGDRKDCNNYRGISLLSLVGKLFAKALLPRLQAVAARILPESQCGFRSARSTIDMIFSLRQLQEKCVEQQKPLYMVFIDLTKAFDYVSRSGLSLVLRRLGCPEILHSIIMGFHNDMQATVQFSGSRSKEFQINCGVKQGCVLAPTLFGIYFSALLSRAFPNPSGIALHTRSSGKLFNLARLRARTKVQDLMVRELLYADDAAFMAHSEAELQQMCDSFASACAELGLRISISKTVVLAQNTPQQPSISINGSLLTVVNKFTYLGSTVTDTNSLDAELDTRLGKASSTFGRLQSRVFKNKHISLHVKVEVYNACVLSTLLYGSESWAMYRRQEHRLNAFHLRCLRSIIGVSWRDRVPNTTVLEETKALDMYTILRTRRLRWSGHVVRMEDSRLPKSILYGQLVNAPRPVGRPRLRYRDVLKRDMKAFGLPTDQWESLAVDRGTWGSLIKKGRHFSNQAYVSFCTQRRIKRQHNRLF